MKRILLFIILIPAALLAQYNNEVTTEESFEESEMYFKSNYLNPFGIINFDKVSPGLINNSFLNLYVNPADLPDLDTSNAMVYLDFRGDRTEAQVVKQYVYPKYYSNYYYPYYSDPRLSTQARTEPEPIFSFGILSYPLKDITDKFMLGGTYQLIQKDENYYNMPYLIYAPRYGLDAFNVKATAESSIPIQERYAGKNEMANEIHLFSLFTGYKFSNELSAGISLEGVIQKRDGGYLNLNNSEYGSTSDNTYSNSSSQNKTERYHHIDISAGVDYFIQHKILLGVKGGILHGNADQNYNSGSGYFYQYNNPQTDSNWSINNSTSSTVQSWNHNGDTKYLSFNFSGDRNNTKNFSGYYKYTWSDVNLTSTSVIYDTSYYASRYVSSYDQSWWNYNGNSNTKDNRTGSGTRTFNTHEIMMNYKWAITKKVTVYAGIYFNSTVTEIHDSEPVIASRYSAYKDTGSNSNYYYSNSNYLYESKRLQWDYNSTYWTLQIPVIFNFDISDYWSIMIGLNRILNNWEITDQTIAYFSERQRIDNGVSKVETNFGESYKQPAQKITEDFVKVFSSFEVRLSQAFKIRLLLDPDFESAFRIAQYWLEFEAKL